MSDITNIKTLKTALSSLTYEQQRHVASQFISLVLDLTSDANIKHVQQVAANPDATDVELMEAYKLAKHAIIRTHSWEWDEVDIKKQAAHYVAEACAICLAPPSHLKGGHNLAWNTAHYCGCARTCASIWHDEEHPDFTTAETDIDNFHNSLFQITNQFIGNLDS